MDKMSDNGVLYILILICLALISHFIYVSNPNQEGEITLLSSQFGYEVKGPHGFLGKITKDNINDEEWNFSGKFDFPNQLYLYLGKNVSISETYPEEVVISFYIYPSKIGDSIFPQNKEKEVQFKIKASNDAHFKVLF